MSTTQKISCVLWFVGAAAVVFALVQSDWMSGNLGQVDLRGVFHHSWSEIDARLGAAAAEKYETAALFGRIVFWGGFAAVVAMLPAAWYFRYGKNFGRLVVGIAITAIGFAGIGFCFSLDDVTRHYPVAVFFIGIVIALAGSVAGLFEPKPNPKSKPLEF